MASPLHPKRSRLPKGELSAGCGAITTCSYHKPLVYYSRALAYSCGRRMLSSSGDFPETLLSILSGEGFDEREHGESLLVFSCGRQSGSEGLVNVFRFYRRGGRFGRACRNRAFPHYIERPSFRDSNSPGPAGYPSNRLLQIVTSVSWSFRSGL